MSQPIETLEPGLYECSIPSDYKSVNAPADPSGAGYIAEINVTKGQSGRKHIILITIIKMIFGLKQFTQTVTTGAGLLLIHKVKIQTDKR